MSRKITPKLIKSICGSDLIAKRGRNLKDAVKNFQKSDDRISAVVSDILDFEVEVDLYDMNYKCSCEYSKSAVCKHIAALLYFAKDNINKKSADSEEDYLDMLKKALSKADKSLLEQFITAEAISSEDMLNKALSYFYLEHKEYTIAEYKKEVNSFISHLIYDYYIPIGKSRELIQYIKNIKLMEPKEAIKKYRAVFETLEAKLTRLDDSYGIIQDAIRFAMSEFIELAKDINKTQKDGSDTIKYLWQRFLKDTDIRHYYTELINRFCTQEEDFQYYKSLIKKEIDKKKDDDKSFIFQEIAEEYVDMLIKLNDKDELEKAFDRFLYMGSNIIVREIEYMLSVGKQEDAIRFFQRNAGNIYNEDAIKIREKISEYLHDTDKKRYIENLIEIFNLSPSYELYEKIKENSGGDWQKMEDKLFKRIKHSPEFIDAYIKNGKTKEAFEKLIEINRTGLYDKYLEILSIRFPHEYFEHYKNAIMKEYEESPYPGRNLYRTTLSKIKNLSLIIGTEEKYIQFLKELKTENARRPAFLSEMEKML